MRVIQEVILVLDQRDEKKRGRHLVCDTEYASGHMAPSQAESRLLKKVKVAKSLAKYEMQLKQDKTEYSK